MMTSHFMRLALLAGLWTVALGCTSRNDQAAIRLCSNSADCPAGRECVDGACVLPEPETRFICRGAELLTVEVRCDDYLCENPTVEELDSVNCLEAPDPLCENDRLTQRGPGRCDAAVGACTYPTIDTIDCLGREVFCDGDALITQVGMGCNDEADACVLEDQTVDCRVPSEDAFDPYCEGDRFVIRPFLSEEIAACDPVATACRTPAALREDCTVDTYRCDGTRSIFQVGGICRAGACEFDADRTVVTDCDAAPPGQCEGDLLIARPAGGLCAPETGQCLYPEPRLTDCSRSLSRCERADGADRAAVPTISTNRAEGSCEDGRCTGETEEIDCTLPLAVGCAESEQPTVIERQGGTCARASGQCLYGEPALRQCEVEYECVDGGSRIRTPVGCAEGEGCLWAEDVVRCETPQSFCLDGVAYNFDADGGCDPAVGRCLDTPADAARPERCPAELHCRDNVLHGPGDPNCDVVDGEAICLGVPLLDCSRPPAARCEDDVLHAFPGSGTCDAVTGCEFGEPVETPCAACLPAGAICVLPHAARLDPGVVALSAGDRPLTATLDASFVMSIEEITRGEVQALIDGGHLEPILGDAPEGCDERCPATGLSWFDAIDIANARSASEGLEPCYGPAGRVIGGDAEDPYRCTGWRLPTEAEWVWAYRGAGRDRFPCGPDGGCLDGQEWFADNADGPRPVGLLPGNPARMRDMGGNAREWVHDVFADFSGGIEPYGPTVGSRRVLRGGSWLTERDALDVYTRYAVDPRERIADVGMRLVRGLAPRPPSTCGLDEITGEEYMLVSSDRSTCVLTPGVPCDDERVRLRCEHGCMAGRCRLAADLSIDELEGANIPQDNGPGGGPDGGGGRDGNGGPGDGDPDGDPPGDPGDVPIPRGGPLPGEGPPDPPDDNNLLVGFEFTSIPGGVFTHGQGDDAQRTTIGHDFWLMTTEMGYLHAYALFGDDDYDLGDFAQVLLRQRLYALLASCDADPFGCLEAPMAGLTRLDGIRLANQLSVLSDLPPCYDHSGAVIDGGRQADPQQCVGYRLPTEAEWTYAAAGGSTHAWPCGDDPGCLVGSAYYRDSAWRVEFDDECPCSGPGCPLDAGNGECLVPASIYGGEPNGFGLVNMAGNLAEWVEDWSLADGRPVAGGLDPYLGPGDGRLGVLKGGAWFDESAALRVDARAVRLPQVAFPALGAGVRLARTIPAAEMPTSLIRGPASTNDEALTVSRSFEIARFEASQRLGIELGHRDVSAFGECDECPIQRVRWIDAARIANALSRRHGLQPCYTDNGFVRASADADPYRCEGWRLPTEAEFMIAGTGLCADGDCIDDVAITLCTSALDPDASTELCTCNPEINALYTESCGDLGVAEVHPDCDDGLSCFGPRQIGTREPGPNGIHDLAGNLREWTHDRWTDAPPAGEDPYGAVSYDHIPCPDAVRACYAVRGGSWAEPRDAVGDRLPQHDLDASTGFRLVRTRHDLEAAP